MKTSSKIKEYEVWLKIFQPYKKCHNFNDETIMACGVYEVSSIPDKKEIICHGCPKRISWQGWKGRDKEYVKRLYKESI